MIVYSVAKQKAYKSLLSIPTIRLVRSDRVGVTADFLRITDWSPFICSARLYQQQTADEFYSFIKAAEDYCQPLQPMKARVDQPWMTAQIQQRINTRRALFRAGNRAKYKALSERIEREINKRKFKYVWRKFSSKNPSYWNFVNDFRELNQAASEDLTLATALNEGFVGVWNGLVQPDLSAFTTATCPPPKEPLFTAANVSECMRELNTSSPGPDGISAKLLKSNRLELCDVTHMFNAWVSI